MADLPVDTNLIRQFLCGPSPTLPVNRPISYAAYPLDNVNYSSTPPPRLETNKCSYISSDRRQISRQVEEDSRLRFLHCPSTPKHATVAYATTSVVNQVTVRG